MTVTSTGVILGNYRAGKNTITQAFGGAPAQAEGDPLTRNYYNREEVQVNKTLNDINIHLKGTPIDFGRMPNTRARMTRMREANFFVMVVAHSDVPADPLNGISLTYFQEDIKRARKQQCPVVIIGTVEGVLVCEENKRVAQFAKSINASYHVFNKKSLQDRKEEELKRLDDIILSTVDAASKIDTATLPEEPKTVTKNTPPAAPLRKAGIGAWFSSKFSRSKPAPATPTPAPVVAEVQKPLPVAEAKKTEPAPLILTPVVSEPVVPIIAPSFKTELEDAAALQKAITASMLKNPESGTTVSILPEVA